MLTMKDSLDHQIDLSTKLDEADKLLLRRLFRRMTKAEAEALVVLIEEIADRELLDRI